MCVEGKSVGNCAVVLKEPRPEFNGRPEPKTDSTTNQIVAADGSRRTLPESKKSAPTAIGGYGLLNPSSPALGYFTTRAFVISLAVCALAGIISAQAAADSVWLRHDGEALELGNDLVRVRCEVRDGRAQQQFFARQSGGWALVAQSLRPARPFPAEGNRLFQSGVDARRWLVSEVLASAEVANGDGATPCIRLHGAARDVEIEQTISSKPGDRHFHLEVSARIPGTPPKLDYLLSTFTFELSRVPEFVHTPTLKYTEQRWPGPARDQVLGDRCFHAPAVILQEAGLFAALVPDLAALNADRVVSPDARRQMNVPRNQFSVPVEADKYTMPTALDLNVLSGITPKPILSFGLMD